MKRLCAFLLGLFVLCWTESLWAGPADFSALAEKCGPAVVNIGTERKTSSSGPEDFFGEMFRNLPPGFERFFGFEGQERQTLPAALTEIPGFGFSDFR